MVVLRVRFNYVNQLEFEILGGFSVCYSFNMSQNTFEEDGFISPNDQYFNKNFEDDNIFE